MLTMNKLYHQDLPINTKYIHDGYLCRVIAPPQSWNMEDMDIVVGMHIAKMSMSGDFASLIYPRNTGAIWYIPEDIEIVKTKQYGGSRFIAVEHIKETK